MQEKRKDHFTPRYKRANVGLDAIMVVVVLLAFGLISIVGHTLLEEVNNVTQSDTENFHNTSRQTLQAVTDTNDSLLDNSFAFFFALMWVLAVVASFFVDAHPVFLIVALLIIIVLIFIAATIDNVYAEVTDDPLLSTAAAGFTKTNWIMDHIVLVILGIAISVAIALYAKKQWL